MGGANYQVVCYLANSGLILASVATELLVGPFNMTDDWVLGLFYENMIYEKNVKKQLHLTYNTTNKCSFFS
jgi:hypothetical protein